MKCGNCKHSDLAHEQQGTGRCVELVASEPDPEFPVAKSFKFCGCPQFLDLTRPQPSSVIGSLQVNAIKVICEILYQLTPKQRVYIIEHLHSHFGVDR